MKLWIPILILALSVGSLCVWDTIYSSKVFDKLISSSDYIESQLKSTDIISEDLEIAVVDLNKFWTKKMDVLSISISRKDMQPVSDYLQYLYSAIENNNIEDAKTYSRLLNYNIMGLKETLSFSCMNLL